MALRDQGCCKSSPTRTFCTRQQPLFCAPPLEEVSPAPRGVIPPARAAEKFIGHMLGQADFEGIVGRRASAPSSTRAATKACRQHWASHHAARNIQHAQLTQGHRLPQANGDGEMVVRNCSDVRNEAGRRRHVLPSPYRRSSSSRRTRSAHRQARPTKPSHAEVAQHMPLSGLCYRQLVVYSWTKVRSTYEYMHDERKLLHTARRP